jgi:hypothetical protein
VCRPFTSAEIHYYDSARAEEAHSWLLEVPVAV